MTKHTKYKTKICTKTSSVKVHEEKTNKGTNNMIVIK